MDYQKFIEQLPTLFESWEQDAVRPRADLFQHLLQQTQEIITVNMMQLLNFAVACMEPDEIYCEIGPTEGATLTGALSNHPERMAYVVSNFSEFDASNRTLEGLIENLAKSNLQEQVFLCDQNFEEFFLGLRELETDDKIGVYFYNGLHDYRSQLLGLLLIRPFLAKKALIIVGNSSWPTVQQAIVDFVSANPECQIILDLSTTVAHRHSFRNGTHILSWDINSKYNYSWPTLCQMRQEAVIRAIHNLKLFEQKEEESNNIYLEALRLHGEKQFVASERKYKDFLLWRNDCAEAWLNLGILYYESEKYQEAILALLKSLKIAPSNAWLHYTIGLTSEKQKNLTQAITAYRQAVTINPQLIDAYNNLGNVLTQTGETIQAEAVYYQSIAAHPNHFGSYLNLGNLLMDRNEINRAIEAYQKALELSPNNPDILSNLNLAINAKDNPAQHLLNIVNKLYQNGEYEKVVEYFDLFLETQIGDAEIYLKLSECLRRLNRVEEFISTLEKGLQLYPTESRLYFSLIINLQRIGRTPEAILKAKTASQSLPDNYTFTILKNLIVPIVYNNQDEVNYHRRRFVEGLQALIQQTSLETIETRRNALAGISRVTNFYLPFQGCNDLELQWQYGNLVHQIMKANYPEWVKPLLIPPLKDSHKVRIGYMSAYLHSYSGTLWLTGWLRYCDKSSFEVYCYYTGNERDSVTQQFQDYSDVFHHIPDSLTAICEQIISDELHILVFPEIGMDPQTMQMAGLRLAPVQCTAWGHPVTSGLPTVDYFLSSDLMEPDDAREHYSETLIRLPNIGVSYPKPDIPPVTKTRADFQLQDSSIIYLCCQAPFKYLPQYDYIFTEIARRVSQAQFVFLRGSLLDRRLQRAFTRAGLKSEDFCTFLTIPERYDYLMINSLSDIYLDTLSWSGGNTTLEAIACGLPIVTCPGKFMRGRHSYGFLKMLGVTDTIAQTESEYIEIAVKLGLEPAWRREIVQRMSECSDHLYDDRTCVAGLEAFYKQVVHQLT